MSEQSQSSGYEQLLVDDHIQLRAVGEDEASILFEQTDGSREYLAEYLPWVNHTKSSADTLSFIRMKQKERLEGSEYGFGIYFDDRLVGHTSLMHITDDKTPEIGYWISNDYSGKGITTKTAEAVSKFGFHDLGLKEIVIKAAVGNIASNAIAQKLGYEISGTEQSDNGTIINIWRKINE